MRSLPGFLYISGKDNVCCLNKVIYGIQQSPRAWPGRLEGLCLRMGINSAFESHSRETQKQQCDSTNGVWWWHCDHYKWLAWGGSLEMFHGERV